MDDCARIKRLGTFLLLSLILFVFLHRLWLERSAMPIQRTFALQQQPAAVFADPLLRTLQKYQRKLAYKMPLHKTPETDLEYFFDS